MQHKFLSIITLTLTAAFAQTCYAANPPALLSRGEVNRYGLDRAWYSQIAIDGRTTKIEHTLLDRNLFFIVTNKNDLIVLNAETGQSLWSRRIVDSDMKPYAPAANLRTVAVVCGSEVQIFDRRNGRLLWYQALPAAASAACQLTDFYLYVPLVDQRIACFPMEELKAPSPGLIALVKQYDDIGYTLDPYSGKVTKKSNLIVSTEELVTSQKGEKKPTPSKRLLELVPEYAKINMILDPYTGEIREADKAVASWWRDNMTEINAPLKGKMELDKLLEEELMQLRKSQRQENAANLSNDPELENAPFFLKPYKSTPLFCYSFGTTMIQPTISYDSARHEVLTWFTDRGYMFFAEALHDKELRVEITSGWILDDTPGGQNAYVAKAKRVVFDTAQGEDFSIYIQNIKGREAPSQKVGDRISVMYRGRWEVVSVTRGGGTSSSNGNSFALQYRIAITPALSYKKETKTSRFEGSIARDIVYQPAVVQKNLRDVNSRFLTVVGSASGFVYAYDSKSSETRWWQSLGSPISNRMTVVKDRIYVPCMDGTLYCLDSNRGILYIKDNEIQYIKKSDIVQYTESGDFSYSEDGEIQSIKKSDIIRHIEEGDILWRSPGIDSFIAASPDWLYVKNTSGDLAIVNPKNGAQTTLFSLKAYKDVYYNNENDRIYLITGTGLVQCLHEIGREYPVRHVNPLESYLDYKETDEERRRLIQMPEIPNGVRQQPQQAPQGGASRSSTRPTSETSSLDAEVSSAPGPEAFGFDSGFPSPITTPTVEQPPQDDSFNDDFGLGDFGSSDF